MTSYREANSAGRFPHVDHQGARPFDAALRAAVRDRGLTLDRLRSHLARRGIKVGLSSLSDWQHGRSRPGSAKSRQAVHALEEILGLRHAALLSLLPDPSGPGHKRPDESGSPPGEVLPAVPIARDDIHILSYHHTAWLNETGQAYRDQSRRVVRAQRDGVDRFVQRYIGDPGCDIKRVELGYLRNCRLGRVARDNRSPVMLIELIFDETLAAGETWVFGSEIFDRTGGPCQEYAHGFAQPEDQHVLELRFDPRALPVDCHVYRRGSPDGPAIRTADLTLSSRNAVHLVATDLRDGVLGIAWRWP